MPEDDAPLCRTCGVQYPVGAVPEVCVICADERQWVPAGGQLWTSLEQLRAEGHRCELRGLEPGLTGVGVAPGLGIGQRALVVQTPDGNVLWDCIGYLDDEAVDGLRQLGGIHAIGVSHPHFYGAMVDWSRAFGAPLYLPEADRDWVVRAGDEIVWWSDEVDVLPDVRLVQCGGHFDGSAILHWGGGAGGRGAVLVGDTATVVADRKHVAFMRSYPNLIPLPATDVETIVGAIQRYPFDRIYGGWWDRVIDQGGREAVNRSAARHIAWIRGSGRQFSGGHA